MSTVFRSTDKVAAFKAKMEFWGRPVNIGIFDVSNISRDFERDWARAFFLPAGAWSPFSAFRRVWALLPNHKRPQNWEGMDPRSIWEQAGWINFVRARRGINYLTSQMIVALEVCWRQVQISIHSGLKSRRNILRPPQKHWKACFHFQYPIFVRQDFLQWQQPEWNYRVDWT